MNDKKPALDDLPEALIADNHPGFSFVWVVPIVALLIGLVLIYREYSSLGPSINIVFRSAEGIEPKQTEIRYRDVAIGKVKNVEFNDDLSQVVVTAQLQKGMDALLSRNTRFWVVRPRIGASGASGISTLLSGVYIAVDPGKGEGYTEDFVGLEEPPKILSDAKGRLFRLKAEQLGSISLGSPVYYRQIQVGEVTGYRLAEDGSHVDMDVFIDAPHDQLVRNTTRFWNVSGVGMELSPDGLNVQFESLVSLFAGGVAFDTPRSLEKDTLAEEGSVFHLYDSRKKSEERSGRLKLPYVLYFDDSVRGLSVGAGVEFRGIPVGEVLDITLAKREDDQPVHIAVLIALEPDRVPFSKDVHYPVESDLDDDVRRKLFQKALDELVARGLRARLITGNMLTGQLVVDMDLEPEASLASIDYSGKYPVLPTAPNSLSNITSSLVTLLGKLKRLPLDEMGNHLLNFSEGMDKLVNNPDLQQSAEDLGQALKELNALVGTLNSKAPQIMDEIDGLGVDARHMVVQMEKMFQTLEKSLSDQGSMGGELSRTMRELNAAARAVRGVADYLERHPEALLQGKTQ
ncbi:PqiB family protein [Thiolapillus brandeum]|uniref:Paraquat-inducible protein B n=1 Tax=Thiolapillus brandeum TaxID=1076588 RepID=A0A7U6JI10_9GAMM|nr:MlaD family protein [Thiolapillus brandeum]BAO44841.1 paraquat-inducible protein B [Thiolapillus brandeum]